mgnify:CR=1 FL=1
MEKRKANIAPFFIRHGGDPSSVEFCHKIGLDYVSWEVTRECVMAGLEQVKPWGFLGDMGQAVHDLAKKNGYSVVRDVGGHGVGIQFHEEPWVSYVTRRGQEMVMAPGMMFTIEPMINMGTDDIYVDADNDWTIYTEDGLPSAQWEIQVLVTETGHEVISW